MNDFLAFVFSEEGMRLGFMVCLALAAWWILFIVFLRWRTIVAGGSKFLSLSTRSSVFTNRFLKYGLASFVIVAVGFIAILPSLSGGSSSAAIDQAEAACLDWFKTDSSVGARDAFLDGTWERDGHIVVEIGFERTNTNYSSRLCVYDPVARNMQAPNNFTRSRWE